MKPLLVWALFLVVIFTQYVESYGVLHKILKINENASIDELKIAYEKLVKQWYKANKMFAAEAEILHLKLVQAYKELKSQMDIDFHDKNLLPSDYYKSAIQSLSIDVLHRISVPLNSYNTALLKNSSERIHLVLFYKVNYSNSRIIQNWFNLLEILTPFGVVMVTINMEYENIENTTSILPEYPSSFPHLVLLIDGVVVPYNNDEFVDFMIMEFIRRNLPENLFQFVVDGSVKKYLGSWHQESKVRTLIFQPNLPVRLHYLLIAFLHRHTVLFGFVNLANENSRGIQWRMNVTNKVDTFALFKENEEMPLLKICLPSIPAKLLNDTITKNRHLILPRITSQEIFDELCSLQSQKHSLCVILVIENSLHPRNFDPKISFRRFIEEYSQQFSSVSFMYLYNDYQPEFELPIEEIKPLDGNQEPYVVALERIDQNYVKYALLMHQHDSWSDYETTEVQLKLSIENVLLRKQFLFTSSFKINDFMEEKPPNLIARILYRLRTYLSKVTFENVLPYVISLGTVLYFFTFFSIRWRKLQCLWNEIILSEDKHTKSEELQTPLQPCKRKQPSSPLVYLDNGKCITTSRELHLHELKAETYNGMVRLLKPGCRTIILMFDRVRAEMLVSQFYKAVWPYRKNKNLLFGYANMEKKATLDWYSELVKACLPEQQEIEINPYFCAGTVLALSGMRKYFCLYHLKHPGILPNKEKGESSFPFTKVAYSDEELLIGLREWLDKLFDGSGSVIRYRVNHWPDFKIL